jgi:hypothetical protein
MRAGFIGFGALIQIAAVSRIHRSAVLRFREVPIMLYGLAILLSGVFSAEPFMDGVPYSAAEANLHGLFATAAGLALCAAMLLYALADAPQRRIGHFVTLALPMLVSFLFAAAPAVASITQRVLWVVGFAWLLYLDKAKEGGT